MNTEATRATSCARGASRPSRAAIISRTRRGSSTPAASGRRPSRSVRIVSTITNGLPSLSAHTRSTASARRAALLPARASARTRAAVAAADSAPSAICATCGSAASSSTSRVSPGASSEILVARGDHEQQRPLGEPAGHEGDEAQAHLVGPVQVLENDEQRTLPRQLGEHGVQALEEAEVSLPRDVRRRGAPPSSGKSRASSARRGDGRPRGRVSSAWPARSASIHGWNGRICSVSCAWPARMRVPRAAAIALISSMSRLLPMPASPADEDDLALAAPRRLQPAAEPPELGLAPDEGRVDGGRRPRARAEAAPGGRGRPGRPLEDLEVEPPRRRLGLHAQLLLQHGHAGLVLAKRGGPPALPRVQPHEGAVGLLLDGIEREQPRGRLGGGVDASLLRDDARRVGRGRLAPARPAARARTPASPRSPPPPRARRRAAAPGRAPPPPRGASGVPRRTSRSKAATSTSSAAGLEGHGVALGDERAGAPGERATQPHHDLTQALAGLPLARLRPEQRGERVARMGAAGAHRQVGEQRLGLARGKRARPPVGPEEEAAQQPEAQPCHRLHG